MPTPSRSRLDLLLGMEFYATSTPGIGGTIRSRLEDFIVEERLRALLKPKHGGYVAALIEKRGIDTFTAARRVARALQVPLDWVSFAGLKDSSAVARQYLSIKGVEASAVQGLSVSGVRVLKVFPFDSPLSPSMVEANSFTVTLRRVELPVDEALSLTRLTMSQLLGHGGPPNYYGYQRFGSRRPNTHLVGRLILEERFKEAVEEFVFHPYPWESEAAKKARESGSVDEALRLMPKSLAYERSVLRYLQRHPGDYEGALKTLPARLVRLMVEAYQAYLFNKALSERLRRLERFSEPIEGDYVMTLEGSWRVKGARGLEEARSQVRSRRGVVAMPLPSRELAKSSPHPFLEEALKKEGLELASLPSPRGPWPRLKPRLRPVVAQLRHPLILTVAEACEGVELALCFALLLERGS